MKKFIALFREPDGRTIQHTNEEMTAHKEVWRQWLAHWYAKEKITDGSILTLNSRIIKEKGASIQDNVHKSNTEIIGGFLLLQAADLQEVTAILCSCPIYEFGGYTEIREYFYEH